MEKDREERDRALEIAFMAWRRLRSSKYAEVDRRTYVCLLQACGRLLGNSKGAGGSDEGDRMRRGEHVESVWRECCQEGLVDDVVLRNFVRAAPDGVWQDALVGVVTGGDGKGLTAAMLPREWTGGR